MIGRRAAFLVGILAVALACPGCGLLFNGRRQRVVITSSPSGATVTIPSAGGAVASTPHVLRLARNQDHLIIVEKEGFETKSVYVSSETEPVSIILDIFLTGGLGLLLDGPLGAIYELEPNRFHVTLPENAK